MNDLNFKTFIIVKDTLLLTSLTLNILIPSFLPLSESPLSRASLQGVIKTMENAATKYHPMERQAHKNITVYPHLPLSLDLTWYDFSCSSK